MLVGLIIKVQFTTTVLDDTDDETKINQVDLILGQSDGVADFDCSIAVKDNGRASMLYSNGSDLKAGQIAYASSLHKW